MNMPGEFATALDEIDGYQASDFNLRGMRWKKNGER